MIVDRSTGEQRYPCDDCGVLRTKAEGGTVFTVCDGCWDKHHPPRETTGAKLLSVTREQLIEEVLRLRGELAMHLKGKTAHDEIKCLRALLGESLDLLDEHHEVSHIDLDNPPDEARVYVDLYERTAKERDRFRRENDGLRRELAHMRRMHDEVTHQRDCYMRVAKTTDEDF